MSSTIALHCLFSGRVQGVYFRAQTHDKALELGLSGWVRNLPDGRVEAHVEGAPATIDELLDWCATSMQMARVDHIERENTDMEGSGTFTVRY